MKLKKLLKDIPGLQVKGSKDVEITGVSANSKLIAPGNLFVAKKGFADDGARYIPEAIAAGAVAVATDFYDPTFKDVVQIICPDVAQIEGFLAAQYYQYPSDELYAVGITGTNGKTTTAYLVKHLLEHISGPCGLIGSIEYIIGEHRYQAARTTPDVCTNQKMLREMVIQKCSSAVMEVTSHALDQGRVTHIDYDMAIFTNLTQDHLDYHVTMENYCDAKQKLFRSLDPQHRKKQHPYPKTSVVNADCPWHRRMLQECQSKVLTYGIKNHADLIAAGIEFGTLGTTFKVLHGAQSAVCRSPLIGRHNVYNILAAISVGVARQVPLQELVEIMQKAPSIPGRLEPVPNTLGLNIYVDFAHTEDALRNALECLREIKAGRVITVFGCGGDRDKSKRPKMAELAEELSDFTIVTSDNPRSEEPGAICREVAQGFKSGKSHAIEADRRKALEIAINMAVPEDILLVAGKGHEPYQIFAHKTVEFDDRKVAGQLCEAKATAGGRRPSSEVAGILS